MAREGQESKVINQIGNCTLEYKLECKERFYQAQKLLGRNTKSERRKILDNMIPERGAEYVDLLKKELIRQWQAKRAG